MEQSRDRVDPVTAQSRLELSQELQGRIPEACFSCMDCTMYAMRLATRAIMRHEFEPNEAVARIEAYVEGCEGPSDNGSCQSGHNLE